MTALLLFLALLSGAAAAAPAAPPAPEESFGPPWTALLGGWTGEGQGQPGAGGGIATFALDLEKHILVRRAQSDYPAAEGRPAVHHEDLLIIYPESGGAAVRAIFFDNEGHVIEYAASWSADGQALTFTSATRPGAPTFRLGYRVLDPESLSVAFDIAPPGSGTFKPYVSGVMRRSPGR